MKKIKEITKTEQKAIIFDRDETLNFDPGYINDPKNFKLKPGVTTGLALLQKSGYKIIVATNQAGIAKMKITPKQLEAVHKKMEDLLQKENVVLDAIYFCPHKDSDHCQCRKPKDGLIRKAMEDFSLKPENTWIVGDRHRDLIAGESINLKGILLPQKIPETLPDPTNLLFRANNFSEVVQFILEYDFNKEIQKKIFDDYKSTSFAQFLQHKKNENQTIVTTNGVFDLLHPGHLQYLHASARLANTFILALNSDESVSRLKGKTRPLNSFIDRAMVLGNLWFIDAIVQFSEDTPEKFLSLVKPDFHVKGGDYKIADLPEAKVLEKNNAKIFILPFRKGYSTTSIISKMKKGK